MDRMREFIIFTLGFQAAGVVSCQQSKTSKLELACSEEDNMINFG